MRFPRAGAGIALVMVGCGPHAAPPAAPAQTGGTQPDCDRAQAQYEKVLGAQADAIEGDARAQAQARVAAMRGITRQRCREDEWSVEITACLTSATTDEQQQACALQMRADQHRRWFLHMMNGELPTDASSDDKVGPSCLQIEVNYDRLFTEAAAGGEPSLAQRWVARIFFERCLVDGWAEPARTCFSHASVKPACDELLPEAARTALHDHLVDMAESLGVPY